MADYKKRKKDPPWAEAFDRGEITPEQSRKILADIEFNQQMALADDPQLSPDQVAVSLEPEMVIVESPFGRPSEIRWDEDVGFG